jgi:hypothetical protein
MTTTIDITELNEMEVEEDETETTKTAVTAPAPIIPLYNFQRSEPFVEPTSLMVSTATLLCTKEVYPPDISVEHMKQLIYADRQLPHRYWNRKNYHPMQDAVLFVAEGHSYYIYGSSQNVISLTKFISCFFTGFNATKESERMINSKSHATRVNQPSYKYYNCLCVEDIQAKWDEARDLGTEFHRNIELFLNGIPFEQQTIHPENKVCVEQFLKIYEDKKFWDWDIFWTEQPLCYPPALLAGSPDIILQNKSNPKLLSIIDLKRCDNIDYTSFWNVTHGYGPCGHITNNKINTYGIQQSGLKWMLQQYGYQVEHMFLLNVHPKHKKGRIYVVQDFCKEFTEMIRYREQLLDEHHIRRPLHVMGYYDHTGDNGEANSIMRHDNLMTIPSHSTPEVINSAELNETVLIL